MHEPSMAHIEAQPIPSTTGLARVTNNSVTFIWLRLELTKNYVLHQSCIFLLFSVLLISIFEEYFFHCNYLFSKTSQFLEYFLLWIIIYLYLNLVILFLLFFKSINEIFKYQQWIRIMGEIWRLKNAGRNLVT